MTRLLGSLVLVFAVAVLSPVARAEQAGGAAKPKTIEVAGTVSAVATDSLTIKGKGTETWTFTIDKDTTVTVKGATQKNLDLKVAGKDPKLTDFVKVGNYVTVSYHDEGAAKHASSIRVTAAIK
jgi:hypothetical protein